MSRWAEGTYTVLIQLRPDLMSQIFADLKSELRSNQTADRDELEQIHHSVNVCERDPASARITIQGGLIQAQLNVLNSQFFASIGNTTVASEDTVQIQDIDSERALIYLRLRGLDTLHNKIVSETGTRWIFPSFKPYIPLGEMTKVANTDVRHAVNSIRLRTRSMIVEYVTLSCVGADDLENFSLSARSMDSISLEHAQLQRHLRTQGRKPENILQSPRQNGRTSDRDAPMASHSAAGGGCRFAVMVLVVLSTYVLLQVFIHTR